MQFGTYGQESRGGQVYLSRLSASGLVPTEESGMSVKRNGRRTAMNSKDREFERLLRRAAKIAEKDRQSPGHVSRKKRKGSA